MFNGLLELILGEQTINNHLNIIFFLGKTHKIIDSSMGNHNQVYKSWIKDLDISIDQILHIFFNLPILALNFITLMLGFGLNLLKLPQTV